MSEEIGGSGQQTLTIQQAIDLGVKHHNAGRLPEAENIYNLILQSEPDQPVVMHLLGVIAHQVGENDTAVDLITKALVLKPDFVEAHNNLGLALQGLGKLDEAVASYNKTLAIKPDFAEAHSNRGTALHALGKRDEAVASYNKAIAIKTDYAEAHYNLGLALQGLGKLNEAVASYNKALAIKPDLSEVHNNLGYTFQELGKLDDAFTHHRRAITLTPQNNLFWVGLAQSIRTLSFTSVDDELSQDLLSLLDRPSVRPSDIVRPVISALGCHPEFSQILTLVGAKDPDINFPYDKTAARLSTIPLFLRLMSLTSINDLEIERLLIFMRRSMLRETMEGSIKENGLPFAAALALHCFVNEYVYPESDEEKQFVKRLQQQIAELVEQTQGVPPSLIATLGAYRPLHKFTWAQKLADRQWDSNINAVITRQILEPVTELSLRSQLPCLTPVQDTVSQSVRDQYEENPYPRWVNTGIQEKGKAIGSVLRDAPLSLDLGNYVSPEKPEILIAGCGTGQHSLFTANRFSNSRVCAVDLSLSSLSYALRKTEELDVTNIEYAQADIMELGSLGRQFDIIESVGVLHHLGDPLVGWKVLVDLLRPGGLMNLGLYSETARQYIVAGRSLIAEKGYTTSHEDIRQCRQDVITRTENGDLNLEKLLDRRDFYSLSECRDLLFHVQEHRFTLPQIESALKSLKLEFLGFEMRDQNVMRKFKETYPKKSALTSLPQWHKFELNNPDTFWGMYQFWCRKM